MCFLSLPRAAGNVIGAAHKLVPMGPHKPFVPEAKYPCSMSHAEHTEEQQASILSRALNVIAQLSRLLCPRARGPSGGSQS